MTPVYLTDDELVYLVRELKHTKTMLLALTLRREKKDGQKLKEKRLTTIGTIDRILRKLTGTAKA